MPQRSRLLPTLLLSLDLVTVVVSFYLAVPIRNYGFPTMIPVDIASLDNILALALPFLAFSMYHMGLYENWGTRSVFKDLELTIKAVLCALLIVVVMIFVLHYFIVSRLFLFIFGLLCLILVPAEKAVGSALVELFLDESTGCRKVLIVGSGERAQELAGSILQQKGSKLQFCGIITEDDAASLPSHLPVLGKLDNFAGVMERSAVDAVVFAVSHQRVPEIQDAFRYCIQVGVVPYVFARPFEEFPGQAQLHYVGDTPFVAFASVHQGTHDIITKRVFDVCFSAAVLLIFAPVALFIAIAIKRTSEGPVIFRQLRVGKNGRLFNLYKFRTMRVDAEDMKSHLARMNEMDGPVFKMRDDPRTTRVGRFLRRTSLDEFPQFLNVLLGHMSVVGPRPPLSQEVSQYELWHRRRLSVKPGLTCLWQVSGRNGLDFHSWMKLDLHYIDNWSWAMDLKILIQTIPAMLKGY